ncbi:MAG: hypothetical protein ACYTGX_08940 [Planctomycetota bacterium]|jgi:hypothetical protein
MRHHRWLVRAAWLNAGTHAAASLGMVVLLRPGLPGPGVRDPLDWVVKNPGPWTVGWSLWTASALSFVCLTIVAGLKSWPRAEVARRIGGWLAAALILAAAGADITGQFLMVQAAYTPSGFGQTLDYGIGMAMAAVWHRTWTGRTRLLGYASGFIGLVLTPLALDPAAFAWPVTVVTALLMSCVIAWSVSLALEPAPVAVVEAAVEEPGDG